MTLITEVKMLMVEHLEKGSPLLLAELDRWEEIIGDDYLHYRYEVERDKDRLRVTPIDN
jgi:hypothetical protein